jgi:iron complex transport system ATP-binding protein
MTDMNPTAAISLLDLGYAFRPGQWVLRHYHLSFGTGRIIAILGPNGRGKTTLLRLLLGGLRPSEGTVHSSQRAAFVPQLFQVAFDYSVLDMVIMGRARRISLFRQPGPADREAAMEALDRLGLAALAGKPFHELSGGQRQLVILARALVSQASVLILDEPTSALDIRHQALVLDQIERLAREQGLTVLFTTHSPQHALDIADDALLMLPNNRHTYGPASDILNEDNLHALYGVPLRRVYAEGIEAICVPRLLPGAANRAVSP